MMKAIGIESFGKRKKENKTITGNDQNMRPMAVRNSTKTQILISLIQSLYSRQRQQSKV